MRTLPLRERHAIAARTGRSSAPWTRPRRARYKRPAVGVPVRLGSDLETLVQERPARLVGCESISRHGASRESRDTFRLDFEGGVTLKGRRLASPGVAARIESIVARLDPGRFPRVVARCGAALLETWIPGETLDRKPAERAHLRWAAETLGGVHRTATPLRRRLWLRARRELLARHLRRLVAAGALEGAAARRLEERALANAPRTAELTLIHRDLCPENIVVDPSGRLFSVDNAGARVGAADEDLARTCYRWPLDSAASAEFLDTYRAFRDPRGFLEHRRFWMVAALVHATWIRQSRGYARADVPLRRLLAELAPPPDTQVPCSTSPTARS